MSFGVIYNLTINFCFCFSFLLLFTFVDLLKLLLHFVVAVRFKNLMSSYEIVDKFWLSFLLV